MQHTERLRLCIRGLVQGVGFRPFVYRLAADLGLSGWVQNSSQGVVIEVEGAPETLAAFRRRLQEEKPPHCSIHSLETVHLDPRGHTGFQIQSSSGGRPTAPVLPDIATCSDCLADLFDPSNRRYRYPFTNCTNCGPRYSIILGLPYDRPNTTMRLFPMCDDCRREYEDPANRRFHAQPNACPRCGPSLEAWEPSGRVVASLEQALRVAEEGIRAGQIVALKGLGGFHLVVDARNEAAIARLREFKMREQKPFALMYPSLEMVLRDNLLSEHERDLLLSAACPIVLLERRTGKNAIAPNVAPDNPYLGVMLPYTPLHHLLLSDLGFPVVATSGNLKDEPICIDEREALERLGSLADLFLSHNRPIARPVDDSVARIIHCRESIMRRARGYAPLPLPTEEELPDILALGAHLKNTVAISVANQVVLSQHLGDLETAEALESLRKTASSLLSFHGVTPSMVACDLHPNYISTHEARNSGMEVFQVQHHYSHVLACMAEYGLRPPVLGVSWDGTGYGPDGTVWGGEFLRILDRGFHRVAHLRTFLLPGGEAAVKEPRRCALGLLFAVFGDRIFEELRELPPLAAFTGRELAVLRTVLDRRINAPLTSSAGRLFDAVASVLGIRQVSNYEGQAAMELEFLSSRSQVEGSYPFALSVSQGTGAPETWSVDWEGIVAGILADLKREAPTADIGRTFHNSLCEIMLAVARKCGVEKVALSGGCFQNRLLTERAITILSEGGFHVYWHQRIPTNDGGIAVGQLMAAARDAGGRK